MSTRIDLAQPWIERYLTFTGDGAERLGELRGQGAGAEAEAAVRLGLGQAEEAAKAFTFGIDSLKRLMQAPPGSDDWLRRGLPETQRAFAALSPAAQAVAGSLGPALKEGTLSRSLAGFEARRAAVEGSWQGLLAQASNHVAAGGSAEALRPFLTQSLQSLADLGLVDPGAAPGDEGPARAMTDALATGQARYLAERDPPAARRFLDETPLSPAAKARAAAGVDIAERRALQAKIAADGDRYRRQLEDARAGRDPGQPLTLKDFTLRYGAKEGPLVYRSYLAQLAEWEAWAAVRGRTPDEKYLARERFAGDLSTFNRISAQDDADRLANPVDYVLRYDPLLRGLTGEELQEAIWAAELRAGIPGAFLRPWSAGQADSLAREWLALPADGQARVAWFEKTVLSLPEDQWDAAVRQLEGMGLDQGSPQRLRWALEALKQHNIPSAQVILAAVNSEPKDVAASSWSEPIYSKEMAATLAPAIWKMLETLKEDGLDAPEMPDLIENIKQLGSGNPLVSAYINPLLEKLSLDSTGLEAIQAQWEAVTALGLLAEALEEGVDWNPWRAGQRELYAKAEMEGGLEIHDIGDGEIGIARPGSPSFLTVAGPIGTAILEQRASADPKLDLLSRWVDGSVSNELFLGAIADLLPKKMVSAGYGKAIRWVTDQEFQKTLEHAVNLASTPETRAALGRLLVPTLFAEELSKGDWVNVILSLLPIISTALAIHDTAEAIFDLIHAFGEGTPRDIMVAMGNVAIGVAGGVPLGRGLTGEVRSFSRISELRDLSTKEIELALRSIKNKDDLLLLINSSEDAQVFNDFIKSRYNKKYGRSEKKVIDAINTIISQDKNIESYDIWMSMSKKNRSGRVNHYQGAWTENAADDILTGYYEGQGHKVFRGGYMDGKKQNVSIIDNNGREVVFDTIPDIMILRDGWELRGKKSESSVRFGDKWLNIDDIVIVYEIKSGRSKQKFGEQKFQEFLTKFGRGNDFILGNVPISLIGRDNIVNKLLELDLLEGASEDRVRSVVDNLWFSMPESTSQIKFLTISMALLISLHMVSIEHNGVNGDQG